MARVVDDLVHWFRSRGVDIVHDPFATLGPDNPVQKLSPQLLAEGLPLRDDWFSDLVCAVADLEATNIALRERLSRSWDELHALRRKLAEQQESR